MNTELMGQTNLFGYPDMQSGKMSPEPFQATTDGIFTPCWKNLPNQQSQKFSYLDLRQIKQEKSDGTKPGVLMEMAGPSLGVYMTRNIGESPNAVVESRLSWILEETPLPKYSLSAKACQGILKRAATRGKQLPEVLKKALEKVAQM